MPRRLHRKNPSKQDTAQRETLIWGSTATRIHPHPSSEARVKKIKAKWGSGTAHRVVGLHPDLEVLALGGLHRELHGGGWMRRCRVEFEAGEAPPLLRCRGWLSRVLGVVVEPCGASRGRLRLHRVWGRRYELKRERRGGCGWCGPDPKV
jgi:hypothetical protein